MSIVILTNLKINAKRVHPVAYYFYLVIFGQELDARKYAQDFYWKLKNLKYKVNDVPFLRRDTFFANYIVNFSGQKCQKIWIEFENLENFIITFI